MARPCDSPHADLCDVQRREEHMDLSLPARLRRDSGNLLKTWNEIADELRSGRAQYLRPGWNRQEAVASRRLFSAHCLPAIGDLFAVLAHVDDSILHACALVSESCLAMALHTQ